MDTISLVTGIVAGAAVAAIILHLTGKSKNVSKKEYNALTAKYNESVIAATISDTQLKNSENKIDELLNQLKNERENAAALQNEISNDNQKIASLNANIAFLNEKLNVQKTEFDELQKTAHLQFERIANRLFDEKSSKFSETNKTSIETLLNPLKEDIAKFKTKVEETYDKESKQRFSLEERVKDLIEQTNKVSAEANNLTTALKGDPKKRGIWGEIILAGILEASGLTKDREYAIQQTIKDDEGNDLRPDVIVTLPDERTIIIDSKVSLIAYEAYVSADDDKKQSDSLAAHLNSINTHINLLSDKRYDNLHSSLDYTMMFVPIEPAFLIAVQADPNLWAKAYAKRILLVSPTNLIACLKIISDLWRREYQNKNALQIVAAGEALYEKFVGFTNTFEDIGRSIKATNDRYEKALGQLKDGKGNLINQAIRLKNLGLKSDKKIHENLLTDSFDEDVYVEIESE